MVAQPMSRRLGAPLVALAVCCAALGSAPVASAATIVGHAPPSAGVSFPCAPGNGVQISSVSGGTGYAVPSPGGVITSWQTSASGTVGFQLWRQEGGEWRLLAENTQTGNGSLLSFPVRIPVSGGERLGMNLTQPVTPGCLFKTDVEVDLIGVSNTVPVGSLTPLTLQLGFLFNVAAEVEPDADHDGFGDETQDGCPSDPSRQGACLDVDPPETKINKHPKKRGGKRTTRLTFGADEPGSKFECRLDKGRFVPCRSPFRRTVSPGTHRFRVRAIDASGNRDPTAAAFTWTVVE